MPRPVSLSFDLLETFVKLVENGGDAATTAQELNINQPSMSKRLRYLQLTSPVLSHPWLVRKGKSWQLTEEGQKSLPAVRDLINRYDQLITFADQADRPEVTFACGRQAAVGFVRDAFRQFRKAHPESRVRLSTLRGESRIEGVASGSLDLACVTHSDAHIRDIARRELHVATIRTDRLALVCSRKAPWAKQLERLPKTKLSLSALEQFPLILPEPDADLRRTLDELLSKLGVSSRLDIRLEVGGWRSIMAYVTDGVGVGVVSESAIDGEHELVVRYFGPAIIPSTETKLICRRVFDTPDQLDLSQMAKDFYVALQDTAANRRS